MYAVIGGSGFTSFADMEIVDSISMSTPYGNPSTDAIIGNVSGSRVAFLSRHGPEHTIPPHKVNYRANIWLLREVGVSSVMAVAAVGSITGLDDGGIMIPDQIIDYTYGREHTFFAGEDDTVNHIDFTAPYCEELRQKIINSAASLDFDIMSCGTYGATQGPRFETAAEITRMERDGVDVVGMTGMPEASLAREIGLCYAAIAVSVNPAAGKAEGVISLDDINHNLVFGMEKARSIIRRVLSDV